MNKKAAMQEENSEKAEKTKENESETFNKILDIVEQKKEERKYRPSKTLLHYLLFSLCFHYLFCFLLSGQLTL